MTEWWNTLDSFEKTLWAITLITTLIFIFQSIATFMGMAGDSGLDADFSGDMDGGDALGSGGADGAEGMPFQLFTLRNFINFFLGFGWTVISLQDNIDNRPLTLVIGAVVGILLVTAVMYMFYYMSKLVESGNMKIAGALNKTVQVYLTVPAAKQGTGKVHIKLQNSLRELDAITAGEAITSGSVAKVKEVIDGKLLLIEKI